MNQKFIINEPIQTPDALTLDAQERYAIVSAEMEMRRALGLISSENLDGRDAIESYLDGISRQDKAIDILTTDIATNLDALSPNVEMVMTIPILGIDGQETETAKRLIEVLSKQEDIKSGKVAVFIYVNWPEGRLPDSTYEALKRTSEGLVYVFGSAVPRGVGRSDSPLYDQTYDGLDDGPQIALIRDILNIVVMKKFLTSRSRKIPIILQSDADLVGASPNALKNILSRFRQDPDLQFLQCIVDWDGEIPTADIFPLKLGSLLMRELPWRILKSSLNTTRNLLSRTQVIFSDAIQRGIQVAQAERLDSIAKKGGYGLLKIHEDELDLNMRTTALASGIKCIGVAEDVFVFSNRRAIVSWFVQAIPPISQWAIAFEVDDRVRTIKLSAEDIAERIEQRSIRFEIINAIKLTLQKFSIPQSIPEVYDDGITAILSILGKIGLSANMLSYEVVPKGDGTYFIDLKDISNEGLSSLINTLSLIQ